MMKLLNIFIQSLVVMELLARYSSAATMVYIPLGSGNQVIKVDAATDQIRASYPGVNNPHGLVATPDGEYLVAGSLKETPLKSGQDENAPNSELALIHLAHGHVMSTIPVSGMTHHEAITPDGRYVISTHMTRGNISVLDMEQNKIIKTIATGRAPNYTVVHPNGKHAYVTNTGSNNISEIDISNWTVSGTFESGPAPEHMVLSGDNKTLYVSNPYAGKVSAVSVKTGKVTKSWKLGKGLHGLDVGDDGHTLFVSSKKDSKLSALNTKTGDTREMNLSPAPYHLNTITGTGKVYVSSRKQPKIWVIDQKTLKIINEIKLPAGEGHQMAIVNNGD
jgi:DNA-binding beta-propeller fold protein YncE